MNTIVNYPHLLLQWHPTKNGTLNPKDISCSSNKKFWWKCDIADDHEWEATPNNRSGVHKRQKGSAV